jgi:hypothetical protein
MVGAQNEDAQTNIDGDQRPGGPISLHCVGKGAHSQALFLRRGGPRDLAQQPAHADVAPELDEPSSLAEMGPDVIDAPRNRCASEATGAVGECFLGRQVYKGHPQPCVVGLFGTLTRARPALARPALGPRPPR